MAEQPAKTTEKKEQSVLKYLKMVDKDQKYVIRRSDRSFPFRLSAADHMILCMIQNSGKKKRTLTEILHTMIGTALDCEYNRHLQYIEKLRERIGLQVLTLRRYKEKYGYPPPTIYVVLTSWIQILPDACYVQPSDNGPQCHILAYRAVTIR